MRKNSLFYMLLAGAMTLAGCKNDDSDYSAYITGTGTVNTINITYSASGATVEGDSQGIVSVSGADVTVVSQRADSLLLVLSGATDDGSLTVYRNHRYGIRLNGVSITNADGPAINNQGKKSLFIECADGTVSTLQDGTAYAEALIDQKATLFSEGQMFFRGAGTLNVHANCLNAIASDDYIVIGGDVVINTTTAQTGTNGVKVNDGMYINGGQLTISVASDGGRGVKCDSLMVVSGGTTSITTTGSCKIETIDGVVDTTSAACVKSVYDFTMTGGTLTMLSTGAGGKGLNCTAGVTLSGGTLTATTTGEKFGVVAESTSKPKAVKGTSITVSGGSFLAQVSKTWACDNGYESVDEDEQAANCVTVLGTPATKTLRKKYVNIVY